MDMTIYLLLSFIGWAAPFVGIIVMVVWATWLILENGKGISRPKWKVPHNNELADWYKN